MDFEVARVAGDEQRRIFERLAVLQKLVVGLGKVGTSALVFEGEEAAFPYVGPTVASAVLGGTFFEGEDFAGSVDFSGLGVADQFAEVEKMLLVEARSERSAADHLTMKSAGVTRPRCQQRMDSAARD